MPQRCWFEAISGGDTPLLWASGPEYNVEGSLLDAGFKIRKLRRAGLARYIIRFPVNLTARRNVLPIYTGPRAPR
jgi:hypothetical protein